MIQFLQFVVPRPASVVSFDFGWPLVALLLALVALIALLLYVALLSRHRKASTRSLAPVNRAASVEHPLTPEGAVLVGGELWRARTRGGEHVGRGSSNVFVVGARGHLLEVEPRR